jgi:hypothetical protein
VVHAVGTIVFDADGNVTFEAGTHETEGGPDAICAAAA